MGIYVYPHDCKDFSTTGLCGDLQPIEAYFEEEKNGISQIEMTLHYDKHGKWKEAKVGRYIKAMVPVRVVPFIEDDSYSTTVQKIKIKSGTKQTYVSKKMDVVYLLNKEEDGMYYDKATNIPPDSIVVAKAVAAGIAEIRTDTVKTYIYVDDYDYIETVEIPAALDGVESVTGSARLKPQFFIITSVEQTLDGMIVTAKHVFYELLHNATTYKTENTVQGAAACRQVFDNLISADDRYDIYCDCTDEQTGLDYDRVSPVQALLDPDEGICAKYGLSLIRDNYSIYALKNVGTDRGFVVEYGKNMLSVDCIENIDETYTRIIPFGKDSKGNVIYMDGQIWIDSERINDYPAPRVLLLDCTDTASVGKGMTLEQAKAELKKRAQEELDNGIDKPNMEMTVDFLSLGDTEEYKQYRDLDKVYMFDRITVKDKVRGYDYTAEVVSVRHNLLTGMLESCTIGSLEKASAARKIASWQVPTVDGGNIRLQSIEPGILGTDAVATENLQDGAVIATKVQAGAITAEKIEAGSITADRMKTGTITADSGIIADGCIGTAQIADGSITEAKIVSLNADVIKSGTLQTDRLLLTGEGGVVYEINAASSGLSQSELSEEEYKNKIDGSVLVAKSVTADQIAAQTITANEILSGAITTDKLSADAVTTDKLAAYSVTANKLASDVGSSLDLSSNNSVRLMVDEVQVGGTNLSPDTRLMSSWLLPSGSTRPVTRSVDTEGFGVLSWPADTNKTWRRAMPPNDTRKPYSIYKDKEVTISFEFRGPSWVDDDYLLIYFYADEDLADYTKYKSVTVKLPKTDKWIKAQKIVPVTDALFISGTGTLRQEAMLSVFPANNCTGACEIRKFKVEIGNKATDWSPAPEDGAYTTSAVLDRTGIHLNTGGTFTVDSDNFDIDAEGKMTAKAGSIGGWEIAPGSLKSGSGTSHVRLSTEDTTYGIWAGAEASASAPFRVAKNGTVYLTKLYVTDENGNDQANPVDLRTNYWKMDKAYSRAVQTLSVDGDTLTITLNDGTSVNFKKAVSSVITIDQTWSGGRLVITTTTDGITLSGETTASVNSTPANLEWGGTNDAVATFDVTCDKGTVVGGMTVDASEVYKNGWNECRDNASYASNVYTISENAPGTLYVKVSDGVYSSVGSSWVKTTRATGLYYLPAAKS